MDPIIIKNRIRIILLISISGIFYLLYNALLKERNAARNTNLSDLLKQTGTLQHRESITFILGEDKESDNPYYEEATNYYLSNPKAKTESVVKNCRSLLEARNYLATCPPENGLPWGQVNLVSHGNQWLGLSAKVAPYSKRATAQAINACIDTGGFEAVPNQLLDQHSELFIHGCGIGNNPLLLQAIARAFGGTDTVPSVRASKLFEYYTSVRTNTSVTESERYFARAWHIIYKRGYKPGNTILCNQLKAKYPDSKIDWQDALSRDQPRYPGDIYYYSFEVPLKWVIEYDNKDSIPELKNNRQQLSWIGSQPEITRMLKQVNIPKKDFNWWFRMVRVKHDDGSRSPAVWVKGYSTILCVLKPIVAQNQNTGLLQGPFCPRLDDENYYCYIAGI
jgi:hypothetical protein